MLPRVDDPTERVRSLRCVGAGATGGHRNPALDEGRWLAPIEAPGATPDSRASAAIVLSVVDGAHRSRILGAAKQVASPRLRIALERAADPDVDEAALVEALSAVQAESAQHAERRSRAHDT